MNTNKSIIVKTSLAGFLALALHINANACPNCRDATRNSPEASQAEQYNEAREKEDKPPLAWDVVTFPTHPQFPDVGGSVEMVGLFSIPVGASNPQGAWDFISFVHGDAWAKQKAKSQPWISSHRDYATPKAGMTTNMTAFYQLKPSFRVDYRPLIVQYPRLTAIERIGERKLEEAVKGKKTVSRALQEWANEGDSVLKQIHKNATKTTPPR
jgi:multiple sugar transport system substrate-binding protein